MSAHHVQSVNATRDKNDSLGGQQCIHVHCISKNDTALACYNFDVHQPILIIFGRNVTETASSQIIICFSTSPK